MKKSAFDLFGASPYLSGEMEIALSLADSVERIKLFDDRWRAIYGNLFCCRPRLSGARGRIGRKAEQIEIVAIKALMS